MQKTEKILSLAFLLLLLGLAASRVHSFDVFWQLQSGKYMLATKSFIYQDTFTLAADAPRFEHCWLHDLVLYFSYFLGGYKAISVLKGVLVTATAAALVWAARVRGASWLAILFLAPPALLLTRGGWLERPQLWSFFFFSLFLLILERFRRQGGRLVFLLFPLMVLWTNLHAGSVLAFPILAAYLAGEGGEILLKRSALPKGGYRRLLWVLLLLFVAALLTPYGSMVLKTLLGAPKLGGQGGEGPITALFNMDWRPTTFAGDPYFFYAMGVAALLLLLGWRRFSLTDLFLLGGLALMGMKLSRHTHFLLYGAAALLPSYADAAVAPLLRRLGGRVKTVLRIAGIGAACWSAVYFAWPAYNVYGLFNLGLRTWHYPVEAAEFVREHRLPANLYNTYDWGGYLAWTLYPEYRVFWDGRQNSHEMFRLGWQVMAGHPGWEKILQDFQVNTVVTKACTVDRGERYPVIDKLRESQAWALVFADESSMIFVRRSAVEPQWLARHRLPDSRIDDTILSEAILLARVNPGRYKAFWEMARIYMARKQYPQAFIALQNYLARTPQRDPLAERYYRMLYPMMQPQRQPGGEKG